MKICSRLVSPLVIITFKTPNSYKTHPSAPSSSSLIFIFLFLFLFLVGSIQFIPISRDAKAMLTEDREILNGWPLGLEVMNTRLRMAEPERSPAFDNLHIPSMSFSSLSSSELDTVSTASFFQDHSVSLGRLIGIRPADKTWLYLPTDETDCVSVDVRKTNTAAISGRICIPIVIGIILKMIRSRRNSRS